MTDQPPRVEWQRRLAFVEVAEALGVNTDQIMATMPRHDYVLALYTPHPTDPPRIYAARLQRDGGLLNVVGTPVELPGAWDDIRRRMEEELPRIIERLDD